MVLDLDRLAYGKIEGPGAILAFLADDKSHVGVLVDSLAYQLTSSLERDNRGSSPIPLASLHGQCHCGVLIHQILLPLRRVITVPRL